MVLCSGPHSLLSMVHRSVFDQMLLETLVLIFTKNTWWATSRSKKPKKTSFLDLLLIKYKSRTTKLSRALEELSIY